MLGRNGNYLTSEKPVDLANNTGFAVCPGSSGTRTKCKIFIAHFYVISTGTPGQFVFLLLSPFETITPIQTMSKNS